MNKILWLPVQFLLTCAGLFLFSAAGSLLFYDHELVIHIAKYLHTLKQIFHDVLNPASISIMVDDNGKSYPIFPMLLQLFGYSFLLLVTAFSIAVVVSAVISYLIMFLPGWAKRGCLRILDLFDSLPDVMIVVLLQLFIIWLFKKTDILMFDIYKLGEDKIYVLPIVCLAVLPIAFLTKHFLFQIREEEDKPYVEYSFSKGFSKAYTLWVHLFRNVWVQFYYHIKPIFLLMLSNLLIIEILFNINGFMFVLLKTATAEPSAFFIGMLMIYVPFFIIFSIGRVLLTKTIGGEVEV
ncbi:ABC transporter permease subunit [Rossellomorea vietnamensis]|uniref:ABC transporter permease subunit n=1 Tax=Rossellomorea vietnamensis TaxID=218284 RepID=A0A5D4KBN9_9BACI|nr:ABC transporter permease subunit [Rossellomorea vietnamensis]TYR74814.1 ABC transporter permease subunit [Rossellomorea vietnamensis]